MYYINKLLGRNQEEEPPKVDTTEIVVSDKVKTQIKG